MNILLDITKQSVGTALYIWNYKDDNTFLLYIFTILVICILAALHTWNIQLLTGFITMAVMLAMKADLLNIISSKFLKHDLNINIIIIFIATVFLIIFITILLSFFIKAIDEIQWIIKHKIKNKFTHGEEK